MPGTPRCRTCRRFKAKPENTDVYGRKLAMPHRSGPGGPQNDAEAVKWFRRVAVQGDTEARDWLAKHGKN